MEIIEGKVSNYKGHGDIHRFYGKIGEEIKYYFLDFSPLSNGNMIATTELVEAIDSEVPASHIGLVDNEGNVVIPLENKTIKPITGDILLVERLNPLSQNVLDAIAASKDIKLATGLVSITNTCKNKVMEKLGVSSELVFHNQLSEASIFDINGNNLVNNEYYSYIGVNVDKVYLGKNLVDAPIAEYSMLPPEIQSNTMVPDNAEVENDINVEETAENAEEIKDAVDGVMAEQEVQTQETTENVDAPVEVSPEDVGVVEVPAEGEVAEAPADMPVEVPVEEAAVVETPVEGETAEAPVDMPVEVPAEEAAVVEAPPVEGEVVEAPTDAPSEMPTEEAAVVEAPPVEGEVDESPVDVPVEAPTEETAVEGEIVEEPAEVADEGPVPSPEDAPIVETPVEDAPVEGEVVEAPVEETVPSPEETAVVEAQEIAEAVNGDGFEIPPVPVEAPVEVPVDPATENIVNDESVDNVDDVLNSLFGNLANVEEPVEEATEVPAEETTEVPVEETTEVPTEENPVEEAPVE